MDPSTLHQIPAEHPHKTPQPSSLTTSAAGESDRLSISTMEPVRLRTEIDMVEDIFKKLQKETGAYQFVPLSSGKYLANIWWEVLDCRVAEQKRGTSDPWFYITTNILLDIGGNIVLPQNRQMRFTFKISPLDLLRICYLMERCVDELSGCLSPKDFDSWMRRKEEGVQAGHALTEVQSVTSLYKEIFSMKVPLPRTFRLFFAKVPHSKVIFPDGVIVEENRSAVVCDTSKPDFKYEIRIRIVNISDAMMREENKVEMLELPASQAF